MYSPIQNLKQDIEKVVNQLMPLARNFIIYQDKSKT